MYNTSTYTGTHGELLLIPPTLPSDVDSFTPGHLTSYFGDGAVGRVTNIAIAVTTDIMVFHEMGFHGPSELRAGNVHISGSVERAFINGALLRLMLGPYAANLATETFKVPTFNMKITLDNLKLEGEPGNASLTLHDVMFDSWSFALPEDDFVLERLTFKARHIVAGDQELPT